MDLGLDNKEMDSLRRNTDFPQAMMNQSILSGEATEISDKHPNQSRKMAKEGAL